MAKRKTTAQLSTLASESGPKSINLDLTFGPTVYKFISAAITGTTETGQPAREIACFGTRGDGKTQGALGAMVGHAKRHAESGHPLPVKWIGVTDTFASHKNKTLESINNPLWQGLWQVRDGGHVAVFGSGGSELVHLHLFGIEDQGAMDRVRTETVGVWFEEPAPAAVLVQSSGVSELAWQTAITSQRIASHCHPALMTLNYPDEDHWTWQRFIANPQVNTTYYRVPPGERASASQRDEWMRALANRPDLQRRLLLGQPGTVQLGPEVAVGFNLDLHVAKDKIAPKEGEPLWIGQDFGHTPTAIIGQLWRGYVRVYASLTIDRGGSKQLYEREVMPWLNANAPWALKDSSLIHVKYDPAAPDDESNIESNPATTAEQMVGGYWEPGPVSWEGRKGPLLEVMNKSVGGFPALQLDPVGCKGLISALSGRWYYPQRRDGGVSKDAPAKPNHPWEDYGDSFCYFLCGVLPEVARQYRPRQPTRVLTSHNIFGRHV